MRCKLIEARDCLVKSDQSLRNAIEIIDKGGAHIALVVDEKGHLEGTVTDGDIRRGLLKGESLEASIIKVMCRKFSAVTEKSSEIETESLMKRKSLRQIPVLDKAGRVAGLYLFEDNVRQLSNWVILMAGGTGKRMLPRTETCPKPMLHVNGQPMLEIILEQCVAAGFRRIFIAVHYLKASIMGHFEDGSRWGVTIEYLDEEVPLGTAGALGLLPGRPEAPLLILNGDVLTRVDLSRLIHFHQETNSAATVCVRRQETLMPFGVIRVEGDKVCALEEKPTLVHQVNTGMYVLDPEMCDLLPRGEKCDMTELLHRAIDEKLSVNAFPVHEYWEDIGNLESWNRAQEEWGN